MWKKLVWSPLQQLASESPCVPWRWTKGAEQSEKGWNRKKDLRTKDSLRLDWLHIHKNQPIFSETESFQRFCNILEHSTENCLILKKQNPTQKPMPPAFKLLVNLTRQFVTWEEILAVTMLPHSFSHVQFSIFLSPGLDVVRRFPRGQVSSTKSSLPNSSKYVT